MRHTKRCNLPRRTLKLSRGKTQIKKKGSKGVALYLVNATSTWTVAQTKQDKSQSPHLSILVWLEGGGGGEEDDKREARSRRAKVATLSGLTCRRDVPPWSTSPPDVWLRSRRRFLVIWSVTVSSLMCFFFVWFLRWSWTVVAFACSPSRIFGCFLSCLISDSVCSCGWSWLGTEEGSTGQCFCANSVSDIRVSFVLCFDCW